MAQTFNLVLKTLVNQDVNVELLVAPIYLKNRLEPSEELVRFGVGCRDHFCYTLLFVAEGRCINDPSQRTECEGFGLFPLLAHDVVPFFKNVRILLQVTVLGPPSETLYLFEAKLEVHHDLVVKLLTVGLEFDPEFVCSR